MHKKRNFEGLKDSQIRVGARFAWLGVGDPLFFRKTANLRFVLNSAFGGMCCSKKVLVRGIAEVLLLGGV
jgi:hypothetical protein